MSAEDFGRLQVATNHHLTKNDHELFLKLSGVGRRLVLEDVLAVRDPTPEGESLSEMFRDRVDALLHGRVLGAVFETGFPAVELYAPEDTAMAYVTARDALSRTEEGAFLIDLCTGSSIVPHQLMHEGRLSGFLAVDSNIGEAQRFHQDTGNMQGGHVAVFDVLRDDPASLKVESDHKILVSSNPPWVAVPRILSPETRGKYGNVLPAIDGGEDGLCFYERILEIAREANAERVCLNVSSMCNVKGFLALIKASGFVVEHVNALETYAYGFDAEPEIREHQAGIESAVFREDTRGNRRYLLLGLTLGRGSAGEGVEVLEELLDKYQEEGFDPMSYGAEDFCQRYRLSEEDEARITHRLLCP